MTLAKQVAKSFVTLRLSQTPEVEQEETEEAEKMSSVFSVSSCSKILWQQVTDGRLLRMERNFCQAA
jgi:hypothetical protein